MRSPRTRLLAWLLALAALGGCNLSNLAFAQDNRLHFTSPRSRALVHQPVTVTWTMRDFSVAPAGSGVPSKDRGYFALFVDRAPVRPGQTLLTVADKSCRTTPGCFNAQYLANKGVYTTTSTTFTFQQIPSINSYQKIQLHEVTVVLMDTAGRRIGEEAWYLDFRLARPGS